MNTAAIAERSNPAKILAGFTILIVEDDVDARALFGLALQRAGATVEAASNAEAALALLVSWRPDIVVCDLHLPDIDGYGLMERAHAHPSLRDLPFIAISGSHPAIERTRSLEAGFVKLLTKPMRFAELVTAVRSVGDRARAHTGGRSRS